MSRRACLALVALALVPLPAIADCAEEIAALYKGGALDPFVRPNRHEVTKAMNPDGSMSVVSDVLWDGPVRSLNCMNGACYLMIESTMYQSETAEGPWSLSPSTLPEDPAAFVRQIADDHAENVTDAECLGEQDLDGVAVNVYRYRSQTNPNEFGSWFGGLYTQYVSVESGQVVRIELAEEVASWAPEPSEVVKITEVTYDDSIVLDVPE